MLPLAIEFISGLMYGLIACELSHDGICVEPGDTTLDNRFVSLSSSVCKFTIQIMKLRSFLPLRSLFSGTRTLMLAAPMPCTDFQLASESMITSSICVVPNVFKIAQIYWSISSPSVNAGLLHLARKKQIICLNSIPTFVSLFYFCFPN